MGRRWFKKMRKESWSWPWRRLNPSTLRWERLHFQLSIFDYILFKILSLLEAIYLVLGVCVFYLRFGCRF